MMIKNSIQSLHILNIMDRLQQARTKNMLHIASGQRILAASDDPSGYAISQRMSMEIRSLDQASRNTQQSMSMLRTAEGAVGSTIDILRTLKEKTLAAANGTATDADRRNLQKELNQYIDQIDDNALVTYNGKYLVDGSHQGKSMAVTGAYTNSSLSTNTSFTAALTELQSRSGSNLNILSTDRASISYVKQGRTYTTSFSVSTNTLQDVFNRANQAGGGTVFDSVGMGASSAIGTDEVGNTIYTTDGQNAVTIKMKESGTQAAVSGFTISIEDSSGNVKKTVNAVLDAFSESIQAKDALTGSDVLIAQVGTHAGQSISMGLGDMRASSLGLKGQDGHTLDVTSEQGANAAISVLDNALARALDQSTTIGALQSRMEYTVQNLTTQSENLTSAMSTITDADFAKEITEYTKNTILMQAAQAMLAQSNQNAAWFLNLLKS